MMWVIETRNGSFIQAMSELPQNVKICDLLSDAKLFKTVKQVNKAMVFLGCAAYRGFFPNCRPIKVKLIKEKT